VSICCLRDYPKHGYKDWRSYFSRVPWRLKENVDQRTLDSVVKLFESKPYRLYPDAAEAIPKAKKCGFKTAIVATIAHFQFDEAIRPVKQYIDFVMTGYEAKCDKSNPRMYLRVLEALGVDPQEAIMIGDDFELDVLLPKKLSINTLMLNRNRETKRQSVDAFVYDLDEAMETVIRRHGRS
jgi:HAD superfamily hydrolase (TIGR01549 family)